MESIGFIGLGKMGNAMAGNLLKPGCRRRLYSRTSDKAAAFAGQGVEVENDAANLRSVR